MDRLLAKGDHPEVRRLYGAHIDGSDPLPDLVDVLPAWTRLDQGQSEACTWYSSSVATDVATKAAGQPLGFIPSQISGWAITRALERAAVNPDILPPLENVGCDLNDVVLVYSSKGVVPMLVATSPDGRRGDTYTDDEGGGRGKGNISLEIDPDDYAKASTCLITGTHVLDPADPNLGTKMGAWLKTGPLLIGGPVGADYQRLGPMQVAGPSSPSDPGHAQGVSKWRRTSADPEGWQAFVENSWGPFWATGGGTWAGSAFFRSMWQIFTWSVTRAGLAVPAGRVLA